MYINRIGYNELAYSGFPLKTGPKIRYIRIELEEFKKYEIIDFTFFNLPICSFIIRRQAVKAVEIINCFLQIIKLKIYTGFQSQAEKNCTNGAFEINFLQSVFNTCSY